MSKLWVFCLLLVSAIPSYAGKDAPVQTLTWPDPGPPVIQFTFSKLKELDGGAGKEHPWVTDATAQNLSSKTLGSVNIGDLCLR